MLMQDLKGAFNHKIVITEIVYDNSGSVVLIQSDKSDAFLIIC